MLYVLGVCLDISTTSLIERSLSQVRSLCGSLVFFSTHLRSFGFLALPYIPLLCVPCVPFALLRVPLRPLCFAFPLLCTPFPLLCVPLRSPYVFLDAQFIFVTQYGFPRAWRTMPFTSTQSKLCNEDGMQLFTWCSSGTQKSWNLLIYEILIFAKFVCFSAVLSIPDNGGMYFAASRQHNFAYSFHGCNAK